MKPAKSMRQLMDLIDEHKWDEEDQTQGKGKTKISPPLKDEVLGQKGIITIDLRESLLANHQRLTHKWSTC